jgi:Bacterial TniB protein
MKTTSSKKHIESLSGAAKEALAASDVDRIKFIKRKKFISYLKADTILAKLDLLICAPKKIKMPFFLILGEDGSGKTTIAKEFLHRHPANPASDCGCIEREQTVVYAKAPDGPSESELYDNILKSLSIPFKHRDHPSKKAYEIRYHFSLFEVKVLIIDDFHRALNGSSMRQLAFMNAIKILSNKIQIPIALLGKQTILDAINSDMLISSDYPPMSLTKWKFNEDYLALLSDIEKTLPLQRPSNLATSNIGRIILEQSNGRIEDIIKVITTAAIKAINNKTEKIKLAKMG